MKEICSNCLYTGESGHSGRNACRFPLAGLLLGVGVNGITSVIPDSETSGSTLVLVIITIACLFTAFYLLYRCINKSRRACPKCNYGDMIEMNTPEADKLVEQHSLKN